MENPAIGMDRAFSSPDLELEDGHDDEGHEGTETRNGGVVEYRRVMQQSGIDGDWRPWRKSHGG
ncbi:unnamed protein product [Brassica rapa]|uniref:Uncharacterized protein n=1 Tax=Brassica campestris TaxID=3711 RepID=A0A3P5Z2Y2_BRACM|nr:unnamed protein product [Brassica rapa]VDC66558.1 unnamed protein product [Brassica rapa]